MSDAFIDALARARIKIMASENSCFLANVALRMRYEVNNDIPTAGVDGVTIFFNENFFLNEMNAAQRPVLILHEIGHVIREHMGRVGSRDKEIWNWAGDYVINQELKDVGWTPLVWKDASGREHKWLQDDAYCGMSDVEIYDILYQEVQSGMPPQGTGGNNHGAMDDLQGPPQGKSQEDVKNHIQDILVSSAQAAIMQGQPGSIPGDVKVYLDGLLKPKLPLAHHLRRFFKVLNNSSFTWSRPNRRHQARGIYLPAMRGKALCHIAFAFDMSGSVSDADIKRYVSELYNVIKTLKPTKMTLVQFDTRIISEDVLKSVNDLMRLDLCGRGGTCIEPVMEWANREKPEALVVFTDGEFHINASMDPKVPVLWMIHGGKSFKGPFGQTTFFEV